ncbi:hypothetical protein [Flavobacterium sp.]|uniref:hypothetical protein n=1 Tax=Flavobacterium sp. TaxID=239 RepID=UPI00286E23B8|nr:hypothetical protein [Flavobacterium sp.]
MNTKIKNFSKILLLAITILVISATASCSKDEETPVAKPNFQIIGYYVGKYGIGTVTPDRGFSMVVEAGNRVFVADGATLNGSVAGRGTYTLVNNVFNASYSYTGSSTAINITANYDPSTGKFSAGTYGSGTSTTGGGTWFLDRQN